MKVLKRDGRLVDFSTQKIKDAVLKAFKAEEGIIDTYAEEKAENIAEYIETEAMIAVNPLSVEDIQDLVEKGLMACKKKNVAKAYILYRDERNRARQRQSKTITTFGEKLQGIGIENSNANMDENSFSGRIGTASDVMLKQYALDYCMSEKSRNNHLNNEIYIHDLNHYAVGDHNCLSIPFDDLLKKGFKVRQTDVRPANSVNTAFQLVAVIFQLQSLMQFGGVSATHLDWTMVPYVRKSFYKHFCDGMRYVENEPYEGHGGFYKPEETSIEEDFYQSWNKAYKYAMDMTVKEVRQAAEGMFHNLNTLQSRSGGQLPFTSVNFGTCTLPEGRMIIKALLEVSIEGLGKFHKTSIFPCTIFQCARGINRQKGDPNYDLFKLALKNTATRLYPNYANVDWSGNEGYDPSDPRTIFSTMGK